MNRSALLLVVAIAACAPPDQEHRDDAPGTEQPAGPCPALPAGVASGSVGVLDARFDPPEPLVVLMGGGVEVDRASIRFVEAARGGDVLVLRASGSTESYTSYFSSELPLDPAPASVTTLLLDDPSLADDESVLCRIRGAEAVWLAGGDQADYLVRWPDAVRDALHDAVDQGAAVGGTSAGAMAFAGFAFDAAAGSVTSEEALAAPNAGVVHLTLSPFAPEALEDVVVDTHFVARDREGRMLAFLAWAVVNGLGAPRGLGLDEGTALIVEPDAASVTGRRFELLADAGGSARVYESSGVDPDAVDLEGPLSVQGIVRATLDDGDAGVWPPDVSRLPRAGFVVVEGGLISP
jgi:cyanophycinase-like exopeptidase